MPISPEFLGESVSIKAVAAERESQEETVLYQGADLKPLSPIHLSAKRVDDETHFSWIRRSRLDADSWVGKVPLGETEETYRIRLWQGDTLAEESIVTNPSHVTGLSDITHFDVSQGSAEYGWGMRQPINFL